MGGNIGRGRPTTQKHLRGDQGNWRWRQLSCFEFSRPIQKGTNKIL